MIVFLMRIVPGVGNKDHDEAADDEDQEHTGHYSSARGEVNLGLNKGKGKGLNSMENRKVLGKRIL